MDQARTSTVELSAQSLATLAASGTKATSDPSVAVPSYERSDLSPGILHFGVGNFHRAHQAVYLNDLFNAGHDRDWAIVGAGVMPSDEAMRRTLAGKDFLTTIVEQSATDSRAEIAGAMIDYVSPDDFDGLMAWLADPRIRIVSMTITEGGYFIDPATGVFDPDDSGIRADVQNADRPSTVFGLIVAGLRRRQAAGTPPFTVMSCDNIPHNGVVTRNTLVGYAELVDAELAGWIADNVTFPNGMVDRITPATGDRERQILADQFGIADPAPVFCEDFKQWVLEDKFCAGRPSLDRVGVQFVPDVSPYETMKLRVLNGGHAIIAYPAGLMDIEFVHEAMADPLITGFLQKVIRDEIIPVLEPALSSVPGIDLGDYFSVVQRRFSNPKIADTIRRLCLDGSNRQPKFIVPTIAERMQAGTGISGLALESALWCRYCYGTTDSGTEIAPNDPNWDRLNQTARTAKDEPQQWLAMEDIYGDTGRDSAFSAAFSQALRDLCNHGTRETLRRYNSA
ncbi:MAG: mannitol dehydrogenase family protein [Alphaproteobacteria bacterium]